MPRAIAPAQPKAGAPAADPLDPVIAAYLQHARVSKRLAPRTLVLYTLHLGDLQRRAAADGVALPQVSAQHIRRWVAQLHGAGRQGRGLALVLSCWRGLYTWLGQQGRIAANPCDGVRAPKAAQRLPKALGVDDAVTLAAHRQPPEAPGFQPWLEARDIALVELLYSSGLRVSELTGLDAAPGRDAEGWIDLDAAEAHVLGKGGKRRSVPVGAAALQALKQWMGHRTALVGSTAQPALFTGPRGGRMTPQQVWQRVRLRSQQAGLPSAVHPHMLRHSFASHVLQSSGDLRAVQELLGHANIRTTQVYTRLDFQHLAQAYDRAHPRARRNAAAVDPAVTSEPTTPPEPKPTA